MPGLTESVKRHIADALGRCPHGERGEMAKRLARVYGVSVATVYRAAGRKGPRRARAPLKPEYRAWTKITVQLAHRAPKPMPLEIARDAGVESGTLPPEAAEMPVGTMHRIARALALKPRPKRTHRLSADYPMQAVQIDGSSSEHLVVVRALDDGDYLLKLHRRPWSASGYKNKPLGPERLRVLVYSIWDMCTGYALARYTVARGENALDAMDFLCWSLAGHADPRIPFHGLPDDLWSDQGALFKSGPAQDLLERLDIELVVGEAYNKSRMGGVERSHRTRWQSFERALFLLGVDTITLSELNDRLIEFCIKENARRPSRTPVGGRKVYRTDAWVALVNARPADNRLEKLPENPIETMAKEAHRKVDANGLVRWGGVEYELERLHDCRVTARRSMDDGGASPKHIVCEFVNARGETERHIACRWRPRPYGEVRSVAKTPLDEVLDGAPPAFAGADVYAPGKGDDGATANVAPIRTRTSPAPALVNPLDAEHYPDLDTAMRAFFEIYSHRLSEGDRALVAGRLLEGNLAKAAVRDLALELTRVASGGHP